MKTSMMELRMQHSGLGESIPIFADLQGYVEFTGPGTLNLNSFHLTPGFWQNYYLYTEYYDYGKPESAVSRFLSVTHTTTDQIASASDFKEGLTLVAFEPDLADEDQIGSGTFSYQWQRGMDSDGSGVITPEEWVNISGADDRRYTLADQDDVGHVIRYKVTYTDQFDTQRTVYSDPSNSSVSNVNDALIFPTDLVSASVDENISTSTVIYDAHATDADGDELTYSLAPEDLSVLNIDSVTGEVRFNQSPDYEDQTSYQFTVVASDGDLSDWSTFT